jgi:hypothetical protein
MGSWGKSDRLDRPERGFGCENPAKSTFSGPDCATGRKLNHKKDAVLILFPGCPIKPHLSALA